MWAISGSPPPLILFSSSCSALADSAMGKRVLHIPYRDSVLTKLLQSALGGNSRTTLVRSFLEHATLAGLLGSSQHTQGFSLGSALHIMSQPPVPVTLVGDKASTKVNILLLLCCSFWVCYTEYILLSFCLCLVTGMGSRAQHAPGTCSTTEPSLHPEEHN